MTRSQYSSSSKYYQQQFGHEQSPLTVVWIWKTKCVPKIKFFAWLLLNDRLNTRNMLRRRRNIWKKDIIVPCLGMALRRLMSTCSLSTLMPFGLTPCYACPVCRYFVLCILIYFLNAGGFAPMVLVQKKMNNLMHFMYVGVKRPSVYLGFTDDDLKKRYFFNSSFFQTLACTLEFKFILSSQGNISSIFISPTLHMLCEYRLLCFLH